MRYDGLLTWCGRCCTSLGLPKQSRPTGARDSNLISIVLSASEYGQCMTHKRTMLEDEGITLSPEE